MFQVALIYVSFSPGSQPRGRERVNFDSQQTEEKGFELTLVWLTLSLPLGCEPQLTFLSLHLGQSFSLLFGL